ncbi:MarR family winged helix-turn-helix transcriptional regulator [Streptomyces daliensis]|uniref:Winged helix DNA-binding protein n=1 Tax=Streptomyces daliensis TaxID=299421 RepID=A0A8T4IQJ3_9ACTN|nr:winged helix DNA-binding protein [Streptomyces daliensis]
MDRSAGAGTGAEAAEAREEAAVELATVVGGLMRRLRAASPVAGLTPSQRAVLHRVDSGGPTTIAALARAELVRPQSMRTTVGTLEEQGVLARSAHPTDGRQVVFALTEAGRASLAELRRAKYDWLAEAIETRLTPQERQTLAEATGLLKRLMGE